MARRRTRFGQQRQSGPKKQTFKNATPTPTATTPAPASPAAQTLPVDSTYTGQTGLIQLQSQNLLDQDAYQRSQLSSDYGYLPGTQNVDPNNPYSRASLLQRSYQQGQAGTTNSMAARGQLYAGATQRGLDEGTFQYSRGQDSLAKSYQGSLNDLSQKTLSGSFDLQQKQLDADSDRLTRANEQDPVPSDINYKDLARLIAAEKQWTPQQIQQTTATAWSKAARKRRRNSR